MAKKTKKKENFFKSGVRNSWKYIKESRNFIYAAFAIFVFFILVGYFIPAPAFIEQAIREFIASLLVKTQNMSWIELFGFIFFNNTQSSFFGMIFGFIFGILPLLTIIVNGYLLGFVSAKIVETEGIMILWRLLPHGVFELPAVLISMGLGLKIGTFIFKKKKIESLKEFSLKSLKAFLFIIIPLLIIAALIETTLILFSG